MGILLSGALYQFGGMSACLIGSAVMLAICWAITFLLPSKIERTSLAHHAREKPA